jgi:hypothetical protein
VKRVYAGCEVAPGGPLSIDHLGRPGTIQFIRMNRIWQKIRIFRIIRIF